MLLNLIRRKSQIIDMEKVPDKVNVNNCNYKISLEFKKKKNSSAKVFGDTIYLRISDKLSKTTQKEHISSLLSSIKKKLEKRKFRPDPYQIDLNEPFSIAGKKYVVDISYASRKSCKIVLEKNNVFKIVLPDCFDPEDLQDPVKKGIIKALGDHNLEFLKSYVKYVNNKHFNYSLSNVRFKYYRSKWGECNSRNEISINTLLLFCPLEVMEYIIVHELSHIGMMNHSKEYWDKVEEIIPNRKERELWLRQNGANMLNMEVVW